MKEIKPKEAILLIKNGKAGYYSAYANPPTLHDSQYCFQIGRKWFLLSSPNEIEIELKDTIRLSETHGKGIFSINLNVDDEIVNLYREELSRYHNDVVETTDKKVPVFFTHYCLYPDLRN